MRPAIVTKLPLDELTVDKIAFERKRNLLPVEIEEFLKLNNVEFITADVGHPINKISNEAAFKFWKESKSNIVKDFDYIRLEDYPQEYAYLASEWISEAGNRLIVLEKYH
jgi:hypothetical protein